MMNTAAEKHDYTLDEYLALEPESDVRHEFLDGDIRAMVGASVEHNLIVSNLNAVIRPHIRGTPCRVMSSDMKVLIRQANRVYYPDLIVSCSHFDEMVDRYTEALPRLIVEVLSPSTATNDRHTKREHYQLLDSLHDYVLIEQHKPRVKVYSRQPDGRWQERGFVDQDTVILPSIKLQLTMATMYEDVPLRSQKP